MERNSRMTLCLTRIFLFFYTFLLLSCTDKRLDNRLHLRKSSITKNSAILKKQLSTKEPTSLNWQQASQLLFSNSLQIKQSQVQLNEAQKRNTQSLKRLLPSLALSSQFSGSLTSLSDLTSDDLSRRISTSFNIPNPIRFYGQLYQGSLGKVEAEIQHEITKRQTLIRLMRYYDRSVALARSDQQHRNALKKIETLGSSSLGQNLILFKQEAENLKRRKLRHRLELNRFFNTPGSHWVLSGSPPKLPYSKTARIKNLTLGENFGGIFINQQAVTLEKAYLQVLSSRINQIPNINLGLSSPTLYDSEQSSSQSNDQINLFGALTKSIRVDDLLEKSSIKSAKQRRKLTESLILQRLEQEISNFMLLSQQVSLNKKHLSFLSNKMSHLESLETETAESTISKFKVIRKLSDEIKAVNQKQRQLYYQILIGDDTYWQKFYSKHSYLLRLPAS